MLALLERVAPAFTPKALPFGTEPARIAAGAVWLGAGGEIPRPQRFGDLARKYATVPWVFAAIRRKANDVSSIPVRVIRRLEDSAIPVAPDHRLAATLRRINDFMTWIDLVEGTSAMLDICGNAYWLTFHDRRGQFREIWPVRPELVTILASPTEYIAGYQIQAGRETFTFRADQVVHFKEFSPLSDYYGLGPLTAVWNSAVLEEDAQIWNRNLMRNAGRLDGVLKTDQPLTETQAREQAERFRELLAGPRNAGRVVVLGRNTEYKPIATSPKELDFVLSRKLTREEILAALGMRQVLLGLEAGDIGRRSEQIRDYFYSTVRQRVLRIVGTINEFIVPQFNDPSLEVVADIESALLPYEDREALARADALDVQNRIVKPNEIRRRRGLPPYEGGDEFLVPAQMIPVSQAGELAAPPRASGEGA